MRRILAFAAATILAACGGGGPTALTAGSEGTYTPRTINGMALPFEFGQLGSPPSGANMIEVIDDAITLNSDGTWSQSGHSRLTPTGK